MLFMHDNRDQLEMMAPLLCGLFESLGLMINTQKSLLTPAQQIEFVGFQINSDSMTINLPSEKGNLTPKVTSNLSTGSCHAHKESSGYLQSHHSSLTTLQSPTDGTQLSDSQGKLPGGLRHIRLQDIPVQQSSCRPQLVVNPRQTNNGVTYMPTQSLLIIESDALNQGWGAWFGDTSAGRS